MPASREKFLVSESSSEYLVANASKDIVAESDSIDDVACDIFPSCASVPMIALLFYSDSSTDYPNLKKELNTVLNLSSTECVARNYHQMTCLLLPDILKLTVRLSSLNEGSKFSIFSWNHKCTAILAKGSSPDNP